MSFENLKISNFQHLSIEINLEGFVKCSIRGKNKSSIYRDFKTLKNISRYL